MCYLDYKEVIEVDDRECKMFLVGLFLGMSVGMILMAFLIFGQGGNILIEKEVLIQNNLAEYDSKTGEFVLKIEGGK